MNPDLPPQTKQTLELLERVATEILERKRRLGHYAVIWQDGKPFAQRAGGISRWVKTHQ